MFSDPLFWSFVFAAAFIGGFTYPAGKRWIVDPILAKRRQAREAAASAERAKNMPQPVIIGFNPDPSAAGDLQATMRAFARAQTATGWAQSFVHFLLVFAEPFDQQHDETICQREFVELVKRVRGNRSGGQAWTEADSNALIDAAIAWAASKRHVVCVPES